MTEPAITRTSLLDPASITARLTRRSQWAVLYWDGSTIHEANRDWLDLPHKGRKAVRLYTPDGQQVTLEDGKDATGRIFQLKVAVRGIGDANRTWAHLIGLVVLPDTTALCAAWDYRTKTLSTFTDCAAMMRYENIGPLCPEHLGLARP